MNGGFAAAHRPRTTRSTIGFGYGISLRSVQMTHYKHTETAGKSAFALHQRLAHALELDLDRPYCWSSSALKLWSGMSPARWALCQSLT